MALLKGGQDILSRHAKIRFHNRNIMALLKAFNAHAYVIVPLRFHNRNIMALLKVRGLML